MAPRRSVLLGNLEEVLAPLGRGQKKLVVARWSQPDFVAWGQNHLVETSLTLLTVLQARSQVLREPVGMSPDQGAWSRPIRPQPCSGCRPRGLWVISPLGRPHAKGVGQPLPRSGPGG